jgi:hypothetical protein
LLIIIRNGSKIALLTTRNTAVQRPANPLDHEHWIAELALLRRRRGDQGRGASRDLR